MKSSSPKRTRARSSKLTKKGGASSNGGLSSKGGASKKGATKGTAKGLASQRVASAPPVTFQNFISRFPELGRAHQRVAQVVDGAGPLDAKTLALVKVGICLGAGLESALRSHVRRGMQHGATRKEIEQTILSGMNTVGFPRTVAAWAWANEQLDRGT